MSEPLLTLRQRQVLQLKVEGLLNKEIGRKLNIATGTVNCHMSHIYDCLDIHERRQPIRAILTAWRRGEIELFGRPEHFVVRMPPVREYTVKARIVSRGKGTPRFSNLEEMYG